MKTPDITVVVCTYNRAALLKGAFNSLICQETDGKFSYEILVIDDRSTDETSFILREVARSSQIPIRYVRENGDGIAHARNRGIKESSSEWVAFFDDDQLADPNWLKELLALAVKKNACCVGGSRQLYLSESDLFPISPICRAILGEIAWGDEPMKCGRKTFPTTGNVLIRATVFETVGQFDESLIWGGSDQDFFREIRMRGIEAWYAPRALVHHLTPSYRLDKDYLNWRSLLIGNNFAMINKREWGVARTALDCVARIAQAVLVNMPLLVWASARGNEAEKLGRTCLLWRVVGYIHQTLYLLAPRLFPQKGFLAKVEFRNERKSFSKDPSLTNKGMRKNNAFVR